MKKINKIFLSFCIVAAALTSCQDAIEIDQPGRLGAENAFRNVSDLELGILGTYNLLDNTAQIGFTSVITDEVGIGVENGGQRVGLFSQIVNVTDGDAQSIWVTNYAAINSANRIIEAAQTITPDASEQEVYDSVLGQAYAIRAYAHFQLLSYFSTDLTDDNALGVIMVDFVPEVSQTLPRNTNGEVFQLITSDLDRAATLVSASATNVTFITRNFVTALRARMAAYRGQYTQADTYASQVLANVPIATRNQFSSVFADNSNAGIVFKLERTVNDSYDNQATAGGGRAGTLYSFVTAPVGGGNFLEMGRSLFNALSTDDIRFDRYVDDSSVIDPNYATSATYLNSDLLAIGIYEGSEGVNLMNDIKIFRASEMLLIRAEALANSGNINGASNSTAALIKQLRDARYATAQPLPTYANETEAFGDILDERRLELAFQGHRYLDIKRLGQRGNRSVVRDPRDCETNGACTLESTSHLFTMPIPQVELNANSVIRAQQNPGY